VRWREVTREGIRESEGGLSGRRVAVVCLLSLGLNFICSSRLAPAHQRGPPTQCVQEAGIAREKLIARS